MIERIPKNIIEINYRPTDYDEDILLEYQKNNKSIEKIASEYKKVLNIGLIDSIKTIAKVLYASGVEPQLYREWDSSKIMGYVGEALTELIVPGEYVAPGNTGFDINFNGELVEVKTSIKAKVSMRKVQYKTASFLVAHRFHKNRGYLSTHFYPMEIVQFYKPLLNRKRNVVSVDSEKDSWASKYEISLNSLSKFFMCVDAYLREEKFHQIVCDNCLNGCDKFSLKQLESKVFECKKCKHKGTSHWSDRYCNFYIKRKANLIYRVKTQTGEAPKVTTSIPTNYWKPMSFNVKTVRKKYPSRVMANVVW
ncbi:hypothetical protein [Vibrio metschnikovii]|uniref:hypothetical protein n=1 Tax=Vibrio metschnikovii TaxID=28172 RepID=UPI002FC69C6A